MRVKVRLRLVFGAYTTAVVASWDCTVCTAVRHRPHCPTGWMVALYATGGIVMPATRVKRVRAGRMMEASIVGIQRSGVEIRKGK